MAFGLQVLWVGLPTLLVLPVSFELVSFGCGEYHFLW